MPTFHFTSSGPGWTREEVHFGGEPETEEQRRQYEEYRRSRAVQHIFQGYKHVQEGLWAETNLVDIQRDFPDVAPPKFNAQKQYFYILYNQNTREYIFKGEPGYLCLFDHANHSWMYIRSDKRISPEEALCSSYEECSESLRKESKLHEGETYISAMPNR